MNIIILFGLSMILFFIFIGRYRISTLILALVSFIKIYPILLIAAFFSNKTYFKVIISFLFSLILLTTLSLVIFGLEDHINFVKQLPEGFNFVGPIYYGSSVFILKLFLNEQNTTLIIAINIIFGSTLLFLWWIKSTQTDSFSISNSHIMVNMFILLIIINLIFPASNPTYNFLYIIPFYFIIFSLLQYEVKLKYIWLFFLLFFFINGWEIIIYQLPLTQSSLTIKIIGQNKAEYPFLYSLFYSLPFFFNLLFFIWSLLNYEEIKRNIDIIRNSMTSQ
jgi:hypothetical protein